MRLGRITILPAPPPSGRWVQRGAAPRRGSCLLLWPERAFFISGIVSRMNGGAYQAYQALMIDWRCKLPQF